MPRTPMYRLTLEVLSVRITVLTQNQILVALLQVYRGWRAAWVKCKSGDTGDTLWLSADQIPIFWLGHMLLWRGTFFCIRFLLLIWLLRIINTYPETTFLKIEDLAGTSWHSSISLFLLTVKSFVFAYRIYMEVHISHTYPGTDCISAQCSQIDTLKVT
jgi:hypothetical protein